MYEVLSVEKNGHGRLIFIKELDGEKVFQLQLESFWSYTKLAVGTRLKIIDPKLEGNNVIDFLISIID